MNDRPPVEFNLLRSRLFLSIAAALGAVNAIIQFADGNPFEAWFSLAFVAPVLWLLFDSAKGRGEVDLLREVVPVALLFLALVVRGVLVASAWLMEGDRDKAVWSFAIAALSAAGGIFYLWTRLKRLPDGT
jgi:hypothetical protein